MHKYIHTVQCLYIYSKKKNMSKNSSVWLKIENITNMSVYCFYFY